MINKGCRKAFRFATAPFLSLYQLFCRIKRKSRPCGQLCFGIKPDIGMKRMRIGNMYLKQYTKPLPILTPLYLLGNSEFCSSLQIDVQKVFENLLPSGLVMGHLEEDHFIELFGRITFL